MSRKKTAKPAKRKKTTVKLPPLVKPDDSIRFRYILYNLNSPINIYDLRAQRFLYVNNIFAQVLGLSEEESYSQNVENFLKWIHPDDLEILKEKIYFRIRETSAKYSDDENLKITFSVNFRLKGKDGSYLNMISQSSILEWDEYKAPLAILNLLTNVSNHKSDHKIILTISKFDESKREWVLLLREEFMHEPKMLSKRETEIMKLLTHGMNCEMISKHLHISYYTARKHCQNILDATSCKSQEELKELAIKEGWI